MDGETRSTLTVICAQSSDPGHDRGDAIGPVTRRHGRPEMHQGVSAWVALPVPGSTTPDGDLELDHRFEPVDVGTLEQADLDKAHGPGRIAIREVAEPGVARRLARP